MKKITAFFGGSFNPPHRGHLGAALGALRSGMCSKVIWVPSWSQPHKQGKTPAPFKNRLEMAEMMISGSPQMEVSDLEDRLRLQPSYTFEVLKHFAGELPLDETPALLIGGDSLLALHSWYKADELVEKYPILTYPRPGKEITFEALRLHWDENSCQKLLSGVISGVFFEISSTGIRNSMAKSTKAGNINSEDKNILDSSIKEYCTKHHLYEE